LKAGTMPTAVNRRPKPAEPFTGRMLARTERCGRRPIENDDAFVAGGIGVGNGPAGDNRNALGGEVAAADTAVTEAESAALPLAQLLIDLVN
jgi:hypothetical protein